MELATVRQSKFPEVNLLSLVRNVQLDTYFNTVLGVDLEIAFGSIVVVLFESTPPCSAVVCGESDNIVIDFEGYNGFRLGRPSRVSEGDSSRHEECEA